jgi:hypothetical protein
MATILPLKQLEEQKVAVKIQYMVSMDSVYHSVAKGLFVRAAEKVARLDCWIPKSASSFLSFGGPMTFRPFLSSLHPRVPINSKPAPKAMFAMGQDPDAQGMLKTVNLVGLEIPMRILSFRESNMGGLKLAFDACDPAFNFRYTR